MLLIWGKKTRLIKMYYDEDSQCEVCKKTSINYFVNQTYYDLFWIPVFPLLKSVGTYCSNCQNMKSEVFNQKSSDYEKQTKTPIYMHTWLIIFILVLIYAIINTIHINDIEGQKKKTIGRKSDIQEYSNQGMEYKNTDTRIFMFENFS